MRCSCRLHPILCITYQACRITQKEIGERSVGLIVNLITNDAQRLDEVTDIILTFSVRKLKPTDAPIHIDK